MLFKTFVLGSAASESEPGWGLPLSKPGNTNIQHMFTKKVMETRVLVILTDSG